MKNYNLIQMTEDHQLFQEAIANYEDYFEDVASYWALTIEGNPEPIYFVQSDDGAFFFADSEGVIQLENKQLARFLDSLLSYQFKLLN